MDRKWKQAFVGGALSIALAAAAPVVSAAALLDGKTFVTEAGPKGQPADEKDDVLTFRDGQFHSSACDKYGFGKASYQATAQGDALVFTTETSSEKDGRLAWKGTVQGNTIEGTIVYYRKGWFFNPNPEPRERWFKGKIKE
jgi:hypothetical protein